ncbi:MAG: DUF86 domain-containing protein [Acidobacteriota bacterium]
MVDREIVLRRIELIREYAGILKEVLALPESDFVGDRDVYLKAERCLEVIIQAMLDIGNHIISDRQFRRPHRYDEIFEILGDNGVIDPGLAHKLRGLSGLRNILAHAYLDIDRARMREVVVEGFNQFEEYVAHVIELLDRLERK